MWSNNSYRSRSIRHCTDGPARLAVIQDSSLGLLAPLSACTRGGEGMRVRMTTSAEAPPVLRRERRGSRFAWPERTSSVPEPHPPQSDQFNPIFAGHPGT